MNNLLQDLDVHVYLDDILILSESLFHHLERLSAVLQGLGEAHLAVKLAKTTFCSATVTYLGHVLR